MSTATASNFSNHATMDEITTAPQIPSSTSSLRGSRMEDCLKGQNETSGNEPEGDEDPELEPDVEEEADLEREIDDKIADGGSIVDPLLDSPPSYEASIRSQNQRNRFNVQPREDEGRETLPQYSSAISLENMFERKMEIQDVMHRAPDRYWYRVVATLQGTALTFHKFKGAGVFGMTDGRKSPDSPAGMKRGTFIRSYNLQHAEVGIAKDYFKKRYVIRVRAEADQFLLSCMKIETFVHWLQALFTAIDLALPLDEREIPQDQSIPRSRRRRRIQIEGDARLIQEQAEIIRRHFPNLVNSTTLEVPGNQATRPGTAPVTTTPDPDSLTAAQTEAIIHEALGELGLVSRLPRRRRVTMRRRSPNNAPTASSISPEGKWRPEHRWSPSYDLHYARKCMAILTIEAPRKSNTVIIKGKQWIVDWATGTLTKCEPPDYGDDYTGTWKIGPCGTFLKAW